MGFPRQEYWNGLPFPSSADLPSPEIEPESPSLQADSLLTKPPGKASVHYNATKMPKLNTFLTCDCWKKSVVGYREDTLGY